MKRKVNKDQCCHFHGARLLYFQHSPLGDRGSVSLEQNKVFNKTRTFIKEKESQQKKRKLSELSKRKKRKKIKKNIL